MNDCQGGITVGTGGFAALVSVDVRRSVVVENLRVYDQGRASIQDSAFVDAVLGDGVLVNDGSLTAIGNCSSTGNGRDGIHLDGGSVYGGIWTATLNGGIGARAHGGSLILDGCDASLSGGNGFEIIRGSLRGMGGANPFTADNCGGFGFMVESSVVGLRLPAVVQANNNASWGVSLDGSRADIGSVTATGNAGGANIQNGSVVFVQRDVAVGGSTASPGLQVSHSTLVVGGVAAPGSLAIDAGGGVDNGISVIGGVIRVGTNDVRTDTNGNYGVLLTEGSVLRLDSGGITADTNGATGVSLRSSWVGGSGIQANGNGVGLTATRGRVHVSGSITASNNTGSDGIYLDESSMSCGTFITSLNAQRGLACSASSVRAAGGGFALQNTATGGDFEGCDLRFGDVTFQDNGSENLRLVGGTFAVMGRIFADNAGGIGLEVERSTLHATDIEARTAGDAGIRVAAGGKAYFTTGAGVVATGSLLNEGIVLDGGLLVTDQRVTVDNSSGTGVRCVSSSELLVSNDLYADGCQSGVYAEYSRVVIEGNLFVRSGASVAIAANFFRSEVTIGWVQIGTPGPGVGNPGGGLRIVQSRLKTEAILTQDNGGFGLEILGGSSASVGDRVTSTDNVGDDILVDRGSDLSVAGSITATGASPSGLRISGGKVTSGGICDVSGPHAVDNALVYAQGVLIVEGSFVSHNSAAGHGLAVTGAQVYIADGLVGTAGGNAGDGIHLGNGSSGQITGCVLQGNTGSGISVADGSRVALAAISGAGNGGFGLRCERNSHVATSQVPLITVTGVAGDVRLGAAGARTWAQVQGGLAADVSDYATASPEHCTVTV